MVVARGEYTLISENQSTRCGGCGLRITVPAALIGAIVGEFISSNRGVGYLINAASSRYHAADVSAATFALLLVALAMNAGVSVMERARLPWMPRERRPVA